MNAELLLAAHGLDTMTDPELMILYCRSRSGYIDRMQDAILEARFSRLETSEIARKNAGRLLTLAGMIRTKLQVRGVELDRFLPGNGDGT